MDQPKIVKVALLACALFSFALCISSFVSAQSCYFIPCYQGAGLRDLFMVDGGRTFQVVCMALACFAHTFWVYLTLFKTSHSDLRYGMVVTVTGLMGLLLICQTGVWMRKSITIQDLHRHENGQFWYEGIDSLCELDYAAENGTLRTCPPDECVDCSCVMREDPTYGEKLCEAKIQVNTKLSHIYDAVSAFSCLLGLSYFVLTYLLLTWKGALGDMFSAPDFSAPKARGPSAQAARVSRVIPDDSISIHGSGNENADAGFQDGSYQDAL